MNLASNARQQREQEATKRFTDYTPAELEREARLLAIQNEREFVSWHIRVFSFNTPQLIVEVFNLESNEIETLTEAI